MAGVGCREARKVSEVPVQGEVPVQVKRRFRLQARRVPEGVGKLRMRKVCPAGCRLQAQVPEDSGEFR